MERPGPARPLAFFFCLVVALLCCGSISFCRKAELIDAEVIALARSRAVDLRTADDMIVGSGLLLNQAGLVLTCDHIIKQHFILEGKPARLIFIHQRDQQGPAEFVRGEPETDLALLRWQPTGGLTASPFQLDLTSAEAWADGNTVRAGAPALLVGSPYGLSDSVLIGFITNTNRTGTDSEYLNLAFIQTSGLSYPGSSGAAVYLENGRIAGINRATWGWSPGTGIGLTIPAETVRSFLRAPGGRGAADGK